MRVSTWQVICRGCLGRAEVPAGAALLLLAAVAQAQQEPLTATPFTQPEFVEADCSTWFGLTRGARVDCGYLSVLEDRARPDGNVIRLAVARLRRSVPSPRPDPVIYLAGGPGESAVDKAGNVFGDQAIRHHTFITPREEHPEIVAQWANWFYDDPLVAASLGWDFLQEGVHWRYLTPEEKTMGYVARDGSPAVTWPLQVKTYGGDLKRDDGWTRTALRWGPVGTRALNPEWANDPSKQEWILMVATRDLYQPSVQDNFMPANLTFGEDIQDELADLTATIAGGTGLVEQWSTEFIVGSRDIEDQSQWDTYVSELERAGVERYVQIWEDTLRNAGYLN